MIKAVLFDLDGTLLDTVRDIHACVNDMLLKFSYPLITIEQTRAYVGNGARRLIERALPKGVANFGECYSYYRKRFAEDESALTALFPDEERVLNAIRARGWKIAVITNKPQDATERVVRRFFPQGFFDFVGGDSGRFPCKPDPALTLFAADRLGALPEECAFVGDGETDVFTAQNARMTGVSALWGYRTREQLQSAGATRFASDFSELQNILSGL